MPTVLVRKLLRVVWGKVTSGARRTPTMGNRILPIFYYNKSFKYPREIKFIKYEQGPLDYQTDD